MTTKRENEFPMFEIPRRRAPRSGFLPLRAGGVGGGVVLLSCGIENGRQEDVKRARQEEKEEGIKRKEAEVEGRGMRLAFDTACQRPEGWE